MIKDKSPVIREYRRGFKEFFKDKTKPKNDKDGKKLMEEFCYWYNHVRKQSDTGKTPDEMYKEAYGKSKK